MQKTPDTATNEVVIEDREPIPEVLDYLNDTLDELRTISYQIEDEIDDDAFIDALLQDLPPSTFRDGRKRLIADALTLTKLFFERTASKNIRFQIEVVRTNMCRLFHTDNLRQRLLCTYMGPGTEWLDHSNAERCGLGCGCNKKIVKDFSKVNKAKPFQVLVLKGAKSEDGLAVVHRSPPIEENSLTRVLLKIDEWDEGR